MEAVENNLAGSYTSATDATNMATRVPDVTSMQPIHHSCLQPAVKLPNSVITPVNIRNFELALCNYPDKGTAQYLIDGLTNGFSIGYNAPHSASQPKNLLSATMYPGAVTEAINKELKRKHTSGPFRQPPWPNLHCSPLGSREKKDGTRRLILDLSQPTGNSVNDGIPKDEFTVKYAHFDDATDLVHKRGPNCLLSKIDIKHAFRLLPVKPTQWILLGFIWFGLYFIDTRLPMGLRSSPAIFNCFADAVCWIIQTLFNLPHLIHYADDFLLASTSNTNKANNELQTAIAAFHHLGIPIAEDKLEGPTTKLTYLGIEINSEDMTIRVPDDKYDELNNLLPKWLYRRKCTKKELLSLIGKLSFICKVVRPGRIFLRRLIDLSTTVKHLYLHGHCFLGRAQ